jgi:hypothetical protein
MLREKSAWDSAEAPQQMTNDMSCAAVLASTALKNYLIN